MCKQVSWLKRIGENKDPHLLTYGRQTYSSDARFQVIQLMQFTMITDTYQHDIDADDGDDTHHDIDADDGDNSCE